MLNGMTNTAAMSRNGDLYRNIDSIENKCAELISQIDDHLWVSDSRSVVRRNDTENEPIKVADPIFLCCHQSIVDYSCSRKTSQKILDVSNLPQLREAEEFCDAMTKINQPFPEDFLKSFKPTESSTQYVKTVEHPLKPALKKQVAFNLNVDDELGVRHENVAVLGCSHYSPTHWQNQHKCLASTRDDAHAHPKSVIDSQPHVHNGVRPPGNSTAADIRAFLFGSLKKDGKLPKATKNTIVSVKTKRELRKKLKRWPERLKMDEQLSRGKSRKKVLFKIDEPIADHSKNGQKRDSKAVTNLQEVFYEVERSSENEEPSENQNEVYEEKVEPSRMQKNCKIGGNSTHQSLDEVTERKLATRLLKDRMKFCLQNSTRKEKSISFLAP